MLFFFLCFGLSGQGFERYYGEETEANVNTDMIQTTDEGYVFTGTNNTELSYQVYRLDPYGKVLWIYEHPTSSIANLAVRAVIEAANGDLITAGYCNGCEAAGGDAPIIIRLTDNGEVVWVQDQLGVAEDEQINDLVELSNGNIVLAGYREVGASNDDILLLTIDNNGNFLAEQVISPTSADDQANAIIKTSDGNLAIGGFSNNEEDIYLLKTSTAGDSLWSAPYGNGDFNVAYDLIETIDNGYALAGTTKNVGNGNDFALVRTDQNGSLLGFHPYGTMAGDDCKSLTQNSDGSFILAGAQEPTPGQLLPTIIKAESNGNEIYTKNLSAPDQPVILGVAEAVIINKAGQIAVMGQRNVTENAFTERTFYFATTEQDGTYLRNTIHFFSYCKIKV